MTRRQRRMLQLRSRGCNDGTLSLKLPQKGGCTGMATESSKAVFPRRTKSRFDPADRVLRHHTSPVPALLLQSARTDSRNGGDPNHSWDQWGSSAKNTKILAAKRVRLVTMNFFNPIQVAFAEKRTQYEGDATLNGTAFGHLSDFVSGRLEMEELMESVTGPASYGSRFTDDATYFFLSLVEQFPALWNPSRDDYSNSILRSTLWQQISDEMQQRYPDCGPLALDVHFAQRNLCSTAPARACAVTYAPGSEGRADPSAPSSAFLPCRVNASRGEIPNTSHVT